MNPSSVADSQGFTSDDAQKQGRAIEKPAPIDPALQTVIEAWATLPEAIRQAIKLLADSAAGKGAG